MLLLSWHGTILRVEQNTSRLTHAAPVPVRPVGADYRVELTLPLAASALLPGELEAVPGATPGTVHLRRGGLFVAVEPHGRFPAADRKTAGPWETLLPLSDDEAATLRRLLSGTWRVAETATDLPGGAIRLEEGFALQTGADRIDLAQTRPAPGPDGAIMLDLPAGRRTLLPLGAIAPPAEWRLHPALEEHRPREVETLDALHATPGSFLTLPSRPERVHMPVTAHRADADWLYRNPWAGQKPAFGQRHFHSRAVHEADRYVLLQRSVEGMIFGPDGVTSEHGYLDNLAGAMPENMAREADHVFISRATLDAAPRLRGPHAVFYGGNLSNYFHWIIDAMVPLTLLAPNLPAGTTLLLPATLAQFRAKPNGKLDHIEVLEAFGFGDMPRVEVAGQVCHVEDIYWADQCFIEQLAASDLDAARRRALDRLKPASAKGRRIYINRIGTRRVANAAEVENFVRKAGFEIHTMEDLTATQQIELFSQAGFVIGTHGAALSNLVFCPPGTKVIELSPDTGYRPFFALISSKLGLAHGIIPCRTGNGDFFGDITVKLPRLRALLRMLESRL